jgi:hypothetical protein
MSLKCSRYRRWLPWAAFMLLFAELGLAGISRTLQDGYRRRYQNKAMFLKVPIFSERHIIPVGSRLRHRRPGAPRFRWAIRYASWLSISRQRNQVPRERFRDGSGRNHIQVRQDLTRTFQSSAFDTALGTTFTEGLKYTDLEDAKKGYVEDAFERAVREIASTSGAGRRRTAPPASAYQDAMRDIENLKPGTRFNRQVGACSQKIGGRDRTEVATRRGFPAAKPERHCRKDR